MVFREPRGAAEQRAWHQRATPQTSGVVSTLIPVQDAEDLHDQNPNSLQWVFGIHTEDRKEYARLRKLVQKRRDDLEQARLEFERAVPEDMSG